MPNAFVTRLSDSREWAFCHLCGECFLPEYEHRCPRPWSACVRWTVACLVVWLVVVLAFGWVSS